MQQRRFPVLSARFIWGWVVCLGLLGTVAMASPEDARECEPGSSASYGMFSVMATLLRSRPLLLVSMVIRTFLATMLVFNLDLFLKAVVTPALAASIVGAAAAPLAFFVGQTLQPAIFSVVFFGFDDKFLVACLEATGIKQRLADRHMKGKWHAMSTFEKYGSKILIKMTACCFVSGAGLLAFIPVAGPVASALLSGWMVAWDVVYVPLSGMGHRGILRQALLVYKDFRRYHWFGFWAVLLEEIPVAGPAFHVYNVYRAASFLEGLYLD